MTGATGGAASSGAADAAAGGAAAAANGTSPANRTASRPRRVVVLGGGVIGVSTATHLARAGARVELVTAGALADGASGRSLSWLNSAGARSREYHELRMAGVDRYRTLFAADPTREWLRFDGGLHWQAAGLADAERARHTAETRHGYDSHLLAADEVPGAVHGIRPGAVPEVAIRNPGEGWVSLPHLIEHLAAELRALGGAITTDAGVCAVRVEGGRAVGVVTAAGERIDGDAVVVACGASTPGVVEPLGATIPDGSPWSMLVTTEPSAARLRSVVNSPRVAIRPSPGGAYAVDHAWYEGDIRVVDGEPTIDERVVHELVDEANAVVEGGTLRAASWRLGRKPVPGDGEPVFGDLASAPGAYAAFTHSGATLALIAGELIAHELLTGERHPMLATFRPERFAAAG